MHVESSVTHRGRAKKIEPQHGVSRMITNMSHGGLDGRSSTLAWQWRERFLLIQYGSKDERDDLLGYIASVKKRREENRVTLDTQITNCEDMLSNTQTKLGSTTEKDDTLGDQQPRRPR